MATIGSNLSFDTLAFAKALIERGYDRKQAEALAEVTKDYIMDGVATKEFVHSEIHEAVLNLKIWIGGVAIVIIGATATLLKLFS